MDPPFYPPILEYRPGGHGASTAVSLGPGHDELMKLIESKACPESIMAAFKSRHSRLERNYRFSRCLLLCHAVHCRHAELIRRILRKNKIVHARYRGKSHSGIIALNALTEPTLTKDTELIQLLLSRGASVTFPERYLSVVDGSMNILNPLEITIRSDNLEWCSRFLLHIPNSSKVYTSLLHMAVEHNALRCLNCMLEDSKIRKQIDSGKLTPLQIAVNNKNMEITKTLLEHGARPKACMNPKCNAVDVLIEQFSDSLLTSQEEKIIHELVEVGMPVNSNGPYLFPSPAVSALIHSGDMVLSSRASVLCRITHLEVMRRLVDYLLAKEGRLSLLQSQEIVASVATFVNSVFCTTTVMTGDDLWTVIQQAIDCVCDICHVCLERGMHAETWQHPLTGYWHDILARLLSNDQQWGFDGDCCDNAIIAVGKVANLVSLQVASGAMPEPLMDPHMEALLSGSVNFMPIFAVQLHLNTTTKYKVLADLVGTGYILNDGKALEMIHSVSKREKRISENVIKRLDLRIKEVQWLRGKFITLKNLARCCVRSHVPNHNLLAHAHKLPLPSNLQQYLLDWTMD